MSVHETSKLRVLIASNGNRDIAQAQALVVRLSKQINIETRAIVDEGAYSTHRLSQETLTLKNKSFGAHKGRGEAWQDIERSQIDWYKQQAFELCRWADIMVLAPIDADTFAKMLRGIADCLLLEVLRGWDVSKQILLVPGMTTSMWENAMTQRQLSKVMRKWQWIRPLRPILWHYLPGQTSSKCVVSWNGFNELVDMIKHHAELHALGDDIGPISSRPETFTGAPARPAVKLEALLPPELWTSIFEYAGDWELATAFHVHTRLPVPAPWQFNPGAANNRLGIYRCCLQWSFLLSPISRIIERLKIIPPDLTFLPSLCVRLILKFKLTKILAYLEENQKELLINSMYPTFLPDSASSFYPNLEILSWWQDSPAFTPKSYTSQAVDEASALGFINVLEWWDKSGLELKYTEKALEGASKNGHIAVLEWWKRAAEGRKDAAALQLKPGRAIMAAEENNELQVIQWWKRSGILVPDSEAVYQRMELNDGIGVWSQA